MSVCLSVCLNEFNWARLDVKLQPNDRRRFQLFGGVEKRTHCRPEKPGLRDALCVLSRERCSKASQSSSGSSCSTLRHLLRSAATSFQVSVLMFKAFKCTAWRHLCSAAKKGGKLISCQRLAPHKICLSSILRDTPGNPSSENTRDKISLDVSLNGKHSTVPERVQTRKL